MSPGHAGSNRAECCPALAYVSIGLTERKEGERCAADGQDLEKIAHFPRARTCETVDIGKDRLLRRLVAVAAERGGALGDAEADEEIALVQHAVHMKARADGREVLVSKRPMSRVGRAVESGRTAGFMKLVADARTRRILGAAILGLHGDEAIHGVLDLMSADQPVDALRWAVPIHPTVSELWPTVAVDLKPAGGN